MMYKKLIGKILVGATLGGSMFANAEILVILPETGPMASAAESIKRGFMQANQQAGHKYAIRFADVGKKSISNILKTQVSKKTDVIVGPLDRQHVEALVAARPQVKTVTLNQVAARASGVHQFALSKEEDALALTKRMQWDGVENIIVFRERDTRSQTQSFYEAMYQFWGERMQVKDRLPLFTRDDQGILLLGSNDWLVKQTLPKKRIYTLPYAIAEKVQLPSGLVYCDTPSLYVGQWPDVIRAYQQKPVALPFQRLIAFGGDAWQIADFLHTKKTNVPIEFQGRTGRIRIVGEIVERQPQCFRSESSGQQTPL